jgi:hypothetical protein
MMGATYGGSSESFQQHGSGARRQQDYSQAAESTLMKAKNRSEHAAGLTAVITTK